MQSFYAELPESDKAVIDQMWAIVKATDTEIEEKAGDIMSAKNSIVYLQNGVFKYGIAKAKSHYSFHSMVMYANPDIHQFTKEHLKGIKLLKGCVNIPNLNKLSLDAFRQVVQQSAAKDFGPVMAHYKKK